MNDRNALIQEAERLIRAKDITKARVFLMGYSNLIRKILLVLSIYPYVISLKEKAMMRLRS